LLEVGVDDSGGLRSPRSDLRRPRADLDLSRGEEREEAEELVSCTDNGVEAGLLQPCALEEIGALGRVELGDLRLEGGANGHGEGAFGLREIVERLEVLVALEVRDRRLVDVRDVERRL